MAAGMTIGGTNHWVILVLLQMNCVNQAQEQLLFAYTGPLDPQKRNTFTHPLLVLRRSYGRVHPRW